MATTQSTGHPVVELFFGKDDDHCVYDGASILARFSEEDRATVLRVIGDPSAMATTSDLYSIAEELHELGHASAAAEVEQFNHAEGLHECRCAERAYEDFVAEFDDTVAALERRYPGISWWADDVVHSYGLDIVLLFNGLGSDFNQERNRTVWVTFDELGNGRLVTDDTTTQIVSFPTPELGGFVEHLDTLGLSSADTEHFDTWYALPTPVRDTMASLHVHDVRFAGDLLDLQAETRAKDLTFEQLQSAAEALVALPADISSVVLRLLPARAATVEDTIAAVEASAAA